MTGPRVAEIHCRTPAGIGGVTSAPEARSGAVSEGGNGDVSPGGKLALGLVSGTRMEIPACRTDVAGFVTLARDRVRAVRA